MNVAWAGGDELGLSGSYKAMLVRSQTPEPEAQRFGAGLNRLRVELDGPLTSGLALNVQYENQLLLGSYLRTSAFAAQKEVAPPYYWDAQSTYVDTSDAYGVHQLYRATLTYSGEKFDVRLGRQRVAWGVGRFWSALDLLNPVSPTALDREQRAGADALLAHARFGAVSRLALLYAPRQEAQRTSRAVQWHDNTGGVDYSLVAGQLLGQNTLGFDMAGQLGQAGFRVEGARQHMSTAGAFSTAMAGVDYAFPNTLTLMAELYYNGAGTRERSAYDYLAVQAGLKQAVATRYAAVLASYELTPLLRWTSYLLLNADDRSRAFDTKLVWLLQPDIDLTFGTQHFAGRADSEFGRMHGVLHMQLQWFF